MLRAIVLGVALALCAGAAQAQYYPMLPQPSNISPYDYMPRTNGYGQPIQRFQIPTPQYQPLYIQPPQQFHFNCMPMGDGGMSCSGG